MFPTTSVIRPPFVKQLDHVALFAVQQFLKKNSIRFYVLLIFACISVWPVEKERFTIDMGFIAVRFHKHGPRNGLVGIVLFFVPHLFFRGPADSF